jgi:hypothetical protein
VGAAFETGSAPRRQTIAGRGRAKAPITGDFVLNLAEPNAGSPITPSSSGTSGAVSAGPECRVDAKDIETGSMSLTSN